MKMHDNESTLAKVKLTNIQIIDLYRENKELVDFCCKWMESNIETKGCILSMSSIFGLMLIMARVDREDAVNFMRKTFKGIGLTEGCSESHLRDYLIFNKSTQYKAPVKIRLLSVLKVWNSIRIGRPISSRRYVSFNPSRDTFKRAV
jgi:hypothetical protein